MKGSKAKAKAFISVLAAAELLDCDSETIRALAEAGKIGTRRLPLEGARTFYCRDDVVRVAREAITPARSGA